MRVVKTDIEDVKLLEPKLFKDARGYFLETFNLEIYRRSGLNQAFVQDNLSVSKKRTLRGLHLQNPNQQGKLIMVLRGAVLDVAVDVRVGSPTFGRHACVILDDQAHHQLWIPRGFAHGFQVLSDEAIFFYKCDEFYAPKNEISIRWNDPDIAVDWPLDDPLLSDKDATAPFLRDVTDRLPLYKD